MPKKAGPSLLCEWMVGTTIKSALGPPPKPPKPKAKRRDIIKLHVTTDDESGEDTLTVTYPRSERLREKTETPAEVSKAPEPQPEPESQSEPEVVEVVKKVRFEKEATPKKSALKKKTSVTFCEEEESSAEVTSTSASSGEATPDASSSNASSAAETSSAEDTSSGSSSISAKASKSTRSPKSKKLEKRVQSSDSEADSEPHPTCECKECASGRKKQKQGATCEKKKCKKNDKKKKETESESETSVSEAESSVEEKPTPSKKPKEKKKEKKKAEVSSAEGETSESAKETEGESEAVVKKTPEKKKKTQNSDKTERAEKKTSSPKGDEKKKSDEAKEPEKEKEKEKEAEEATSEKTPTGKGKEKEVDDTTPKAKDMDQRLHVTDGYHYTHSRPPNLIAPIRAEVMQTERVVEGQDDPPPNAYYDALHGVLRVYHGSVYGQNGHHMFAPRENATGLPQSFGNSNQTQNPYYHGYNNIMPMPVPQQQPPPHGYEHVPITQGLPIPGWNAMAPPPGYPPYNYQGLPPMPAPWYEQHLDKQGTKGAFSMYNGMGGTPDRKGRSKAREPDNNVMPEVTKPNPYYTKRQSPFSNMGSNRSDGKPPSHSGQSNCSKNGNKDTGPNWDTASRRSVGAWANSSNHGATWGDGGGDTNNNQGGGDRWGSGGGGGNTWGTTNNNNDQWGSNDNNNNTGADTWGTGGGNDQNNPGGWGTTDNGNNGGNTWGDGNNDNQQANDNNGNGGGQGQGQNSPTGGNDPPASMVDNNVIPVAAVTGPPGEQEQSKMPGSWCSDDNGQAAFVDPTWSSYQPPSAVPAWGDPSMAANTGGAVDW